MPTKSPRERSTAMQTLLALIANLSSIAPSMSLGFSAIALPALTDVANPHRLDANQASWVASIASVATPLGCFLSGPISDKFGRKTALLWINAVAFFGWGIIAVAYHLPEQQYATLLIGRLITGLSTGLASMPATVYVAEVSSSKLRGMFTTWSGIFFSLGVVIVYCLGYALQKDWGTIAGITAVIPCVAMLIGMIFMPESHAWLIGKGRITDAKVSMTKIWGVRDCSPEMLEEVDLLISNRDKTKIISTKKSIAAQIAKKIKYLSRPSALKPFAIILTYFFFQQFSGLFVIIFYAIDIVKIAGITFDAYATIVLIALMRLLGSIVVGFISKRAGRRPLSVISGAGMTLCMVGLAGYLLLIELGKINTASWLPVVFILLFLFMGTIGFSTIPFALASELFPTKIRGLTSGLITCLAYSFNFVIVKVYPSMKTSMGSYGVFFFYGAMALLGTVFIVIFLPETRGKSLQEIEEYFGKKKKETDLEEQTEGLKVQIS